MQAISCSDKARFIRITQSIYSTHIKGLTQEHAYQITCELYSKNYGLSCPFPSFQSYQQEFKSLI